MAESPEADGESKKPQLRTGSTEEQTENGGTENHIKQITVPG